MSASALRQPIGYWLNRCDQAITESMNRHLAPYGVNRIDWQVLNVIAKPDRGAVSISDVNDQLRANADPDILSRSVDALLARDYVKYAGQNPDQLMLTEQGNVFWQTLRNQIAHFRTESLQGIPEEDYRITVSVLERMAQNLETCLPVDGEQWHQRLVMVREKTKPDEAR